MEMRSGSPRSGARSCARGRIAGRYRPVSAYCGSIHNAINNAKRFNVYTYELQGNRKLEKEPQISQMTQIWELIHLRHL
jgi:hypothetical protein